MGWPAAASIAYNTSVGAFIIPICLGINILMLLTKTTKTVNIDLWNYWHFAFIGALAYFATDSLLWGFFAAIICYIITLIIADFTAPHFQKFYDKMDGISIPQPFCAGFVPFAWAINKGLDKIPGVNKINIDSEGMKKKFGLMGEPLFLGVDPAYYRSVYRGSASDLGCNKIDDCTQVQEECRSEYRYESGVGDRSPSYTGGVSAADTGDYSAGGYSAW